MPHECTNCGRVFDDGSKEMLSGCPNCGGNKFQFRPASATAAGAEPGGQDAAESPDAAADTADPPDADAADTSADTTDPPAGSDADTSTAWSGAADRALGDRSADDPDGGPLASSREWPNQRDDESSRSDATAASTPDSGSGAAATPAGSSTDSTQDEPTESSTSEGPTAPPTPEDPPEDTAQAQARSDVVSPDEIAAASPDSETASGPETTSDSGAGEPDAPPTDSDGRVIEPSSDERPDLDDLREELNEQFESIKIVAPGEYELNLMELYDRTEYIISLQEDGRYVIEVPDTWDTTPDTDED